jgi:hypothetical protein
LNGTAREEAMTSEETHGEKSSTPRKILELVLCVLHPVAVVLIWYDLAFRRHDWAFTRMGWAVVVIFPFIPFVYVLTGNKFL